MPKAKAGKTGTHHVVVWVGTKQGETDLFTITARNADGNIARMQEVKAQVAAAKFNEVHCETGLSREQANARKAELVAEYRRKGFHRQPRQALPLPMIS